MNVYGQLISAQTENRSANYAGGVAGRIWFNTTSLKYFTDDGTLVRALLRNDGACILGNSATAANNIRFHRGASAVLQFVSGADTTAEGTLSTSLNQISFRAENYTTAAKPAFGNGGRIIFNTDSGGLEFDTGAAWLTVATGTEPAYFTEYPVVLGSGAQVSAGVATHSTWATAIAAAAAGSVIRVLPGTWVENVTVTKQLRFEGSGYGSYLNGSLTFNGSSSYSSLEGVRLNNDLTINSGGNGILVTAVYFPTGKTFLDSGTGNLLEGIQA